MAFELIHEPLLWDLDLYARLDLADAWAFISPVNWYGPTSNMKLLFDRLVCMNGGNPREDLIKHKDPELAMALEHTPEFEALSVNHLEGRTAAFFCYGDGGGDEMDEAGRPNLLRHPEYFDPAHEPFADMRQTYAPLVWQRRLLSAAPAGSRFKSGRHSFTRKRRRREAARMKGSIQ